MCWSLAGSLYTNKMLSLDHGTDFLYVTFHHPNGVKSNQVLHISVLFISVNTTQVFHSCEVRLWWAVNIKTVPKTHPQTGPVWPKINTCQNFGKFGKNTGSKFTTIKLLNTVFHAHMYYVWGQKTTYWNQIVKSDLQSLMASCLEIRRLSLR